MKTDTKTALGFSVKIQAFENFDEADRSAGKPGAALEYLNSSVYSTHTSGSVRELVASVIQGETKVTRLTKPSLDKNKKPIVVKGIPQMENSETDEVYANRALKTFVTGTDAEKSAKTAQIQTAVDAAVEAESAGGIKLSLPSGHKGRLATDFLVIAANMRKAGFVDKFIAQYNTDMAPASFQGDPSDDVQIGWAYKDWQDAKTAQLAKQFAVAA